MKQSRSISKSRRNNTATPSKSQGRKNNGESEFYYCHFKNAIYMGGIKAFQKHGRGIMIHDDGTCAITSYFNDFKNGHNIFYRQNCILSVEYQKNKILEIVIRVRAYLVLLRMGKDQKPEGKSLLLDYNNRQIFYILYRKGVIAQKLVQKDIAIENKIFDLGNLSYLIGDNHAAAVKFEIERDQNIASQKVSSRLQAGFYKKGFLNGLGFNLLIKDPHLSFDSARASNDIFVQLVDRGYYNNSVLNGMGQQKFKNGNSYWGNFKAGVFDGLGILKNEVKKNWVYGQFQSGNLCELLEYSHDGDINRLTKLIYSLHERKNSWINKDMDIQSFQQYFNEINVILESNPTQEMKNLRSKKLQVLKKIQDNFLYENEENENLQMSQNNQQNDPRSSNMKASLQQMNADYKESKKQPQNQRYQINVYKSDKKNSRFKTEVTDPTTTKGSSERAKQSSSRNYLQVPTSNHSSAASVKKDNSKSPLKKGGTQNQEQLSFALDSKRMVGRSRIFKQFSSDEQQLPKFNYGQN